MSNMRVRARRSPPICATFPLRGGGLDIVVLEPRSGSSRLRRSFSKEKVSFLAICFSTTAWFLQLAALAVGKESAFRACVFSVHIAPGASMLTSLCVSFPLSVSLSPSPCLLPLGYPLLCNFPPVLFCGSLEPCCTGGGSQGQEDGTGTRFQPRMTDHHAVRQS